MVFKPFSHLARRSTKAFAHGYAQSLAAASQSSYASTQTPLGSINHYRFGKVPTLQQRETYHQNAVQAAPNPKTNLSNPADSSIEQYFNAWQKHQASEEWHQVLNSKWSCWKHRTGLPSKLLEKDEKKAISSRDAKRPSTLERTRSASALDDIRRVQDEVQKQEEPPKTAAGSVNDGAESITIRSQQPANEIEANAVGLVPDSAPSAGPDTVLVPLNPDNHEKRAFVEQIEILEKAKNYGEIPLVFEAMLRSGHRPPPHTYNSLLTAAIRLSDSLAQVIPKALDIYSSMLRQQLVPDGPMYTMLLDLLSLRALEALDVQTALGLSSRRYGNEEVRTQFLLRSRDIEFAIAIEDDSLEVALRLFNASVNQPSKLVFPTSTYHFLLEACAKYGEVDHMIKVYSHMESNKVLPSASSYPHMIRAFAEYGDLRSAVECYNEYKNLAVADNKGTLALRSRSDQEVYSALVRSYLTCNRETGAEEFLKRIILSLSSSEPEEVVRGWQDLIVNESFLEHALDSGRFHEALTISQDRIESSTTKQIALRRVSIAAADHSQKDVAEAAYSQLQLGSASAPSSIAMLGMYLRGRDLSAARSVWHDLLDQSVLDKNVIEPTVAYCAALADANCSGEALDQARLSFSRIRQSVSSELENQDTVGLIDEGIAHIAKTMEAKSIVPSLTGSMTLLWSMVENGGLLIPVAKQLMAGLRPEDVSRLNWTDTKLALQVEAGIILKTQGNLDHTHFARFAHVLENAISLQMPMDLRTSDLVEECLNKFGQTRPDLLVSWSNYINPASQAPKVSLLNTSSPNGNADPYANTLDLRGSTAIIDELEKHGGSAATALHEALARLRNIRRAGRHPRYIVYSKLIAAAAREGRHNLIQELFGLAQRDMPLVMEYASVRQGWISILDSMLGAFLTIGDRVQAAAYHRQLLDIGSAPSANTFGLYITTLKESTKTFDEATEAVKIFLRAKSEGVEPSSFLYNALIGKLGKARRIDDCLFYFAEMRSRGVRPTSVTYGTIVNALCRVSDERFAEELFDEMESMPNYKPRPAPYNSMMQFYLTTKRDSSKVLEYYRRMQNRNIQPTMHTYKLLIDTYATLEPINLTAAEGIFAAIRASGNKPENVHYASLIHAKGCVLHDMEGARAIFDKVMSETAGLPHPCIYQALSESMVANHCVEDTGDLMADMARRGVEMTAYIANTLIHGWALVKNIHKAKAIYNTVGQERREPSTYEAMARAFLAVEDYDAASAVAREMLSRGYPAAVSGKIVELLGQSSTNSHLTLPKSS